MNRQELIQEISNKKSFLCVGLDTDPMRIPDFLKKEKNPILTFNKAIIDATSDFAVAYKPNTAFYEAMGAEGWETLQETLEYIPKNCLKIADAKRGDIGNTAKKYAKAFFEKLEADAITLSAYMGEDSIKPFLAYKDKWSIVLGLTSNQGSADFQLQTLIQKEKLYSYLIGKVATWGNIENLMFVVGATLAGQLPQIRQVIPKHFLLIPGVGAQGGSLEDVARLGMNKDCALLVNSSRGIIYASNQKDFAQKAKEQAQKLQQEMETLLEKYGFLK